MVQRLKNWLFGPSLIVYIATKMTGRDKLDMINRAKFMCQLLKEKNIIPISPIIEENVDESPGKLINKDEEKLKEFWSRDKYIIRRIAHAVLIDQGEMKSFGVEREYCLNRGVLWKPTVTLLSQGFGCSVAKYEDDGIFYSAHSAVTFLEQNWSSRVQRWKWRLNMLSKSFPKWIVDQIYAWR